MKSINKEIWIIVVVGKLIRIFLFCSDYHGNNMMFQKDKETGEVTKQIMIDFQVTRYGNPCLDLHYYIFSSVQQAVRVSRIKDILKIYLDTFNNVCESLGYPIGVSFQVKIVHSQNKMFEKVLQLIFLQTL